MAISMGLGGVAGTLFSQTAQRSYEQRRQEIFKEYERRATGQYMGDLKIIDGECVEVKDKDPVKLIEHKPE